MEYIRVCHKVEYINNKKEFVIYADYPFLYEFGSEFDLYKQKIKTISENIKEYVKKNLGSIKDATAILVLNGIIIGTFAVSQVMGENIKANSTQETDIVANVADEGKNIFGSEATSQDTLVRSEQEKIENIEKIEKEDTKLDNRLNENVEKNVSKQISTTTSKVVDTNVKKENNKVNNVQKNVISNATQNPSTIVNQDKMIKLRLNNGQVINISLEDYVIGVVGSEMPALFDSEALKSQAVAARTYALKRNSMGGELSASTSDQVYKTNDELKSMWGGSYDVYYNKVKSAVLATKGQVMIYNGNYIDAVYFSTSNGRTEDPVYVWGYTQPYLKSVDSKWDIGTKFFNATKTISKAEVSQKLGVSIESLSQIKINSLTTGTRVNSVSFAGKEFTGVQIRTILGLRSTDFTISESGNNIVFTTKGWGHGVGMSQYGANAMAKSGYSYYQILKHYYTGISIVNR